MTDLNPVQPTLYETVQEAIRVAVLEAIDETTQTLLGAKMSDAELPSLFRTLDAISKRLYQLHAPSDPFERYAAKAEADSAHDVAARLRVEGRVARAIVDKALAENMCISVHDGEEYVIAQSTDRATILNAMASTDMDKLVLRDTDSRYKGTIVLVYGNSGWDVISDHTYALTDWLSPIMELCDQIDRETHNL